MNVLLHYQRHKLCRDWDKISLQPSQLLNDNYVSVPNRWIKDIDGFKSMFLDKETLTNHLLPIALAEYPHEYYVKDACVTVKILDVLIEFIIMSVSCECSSTISFEQVTFNVAYMDEAISIRKLTPSIDLETDSAILFPELYERLNVQCSMAMNIAFNDTSQMCKRSVVICGPRGSGKTHFLARWCNQQKQAFKRLSSYVLILQMDANQHNTTTFPDNVLPTTFTATHNEEESDSTKFSTAILCLKCIISLIGKPEHLQTLTTLSPTSHACIIIIDNFDVTFESSTANSDMESSDTRSFSFLQLSHCIFSLVQLLTDPTFSCNLFLIASSQLDAQQLYSSNNSASSTARCPDFDLVLPLPRLSHLSRKNLIEQLLLTHQLHFDLSTIEDHSAKIADMTRGFSPGNIVNIFQEVIKVRGQQQKSSNVIITYPTQSHALLATFFEAAVSIRRNSEQAILHRFSAAASDGNHLSTTTTERLSLEDFAGYEEVKVKLRRLLQSLKATQRESSDDSSSLTMAVVPVRGVVLHGAVGCGKTFLAQVLAAEAQMTFLPVRSTQLLSKYFGDTEAKLRSLFRAARESAPCVLFFDEFDVLARHRGRHHRNPNGAKSDDGNGADENEDYDGNDDDGGEELQSDLQGRVLSTFLNELDGVHSTKSTDRESSVLVLVACRHIHQLDDALLRPGRLQVHVHLGKPDRDTVVAIMSKYLARVPCGSDLDIPAVVDDQFMQQRPSCAQAKAVCTDAIMAAIREDIERMENMKQSKEISTQDDQVEVASYYGQVCQRHFILKH